MKQPCSNIYKTFREQAGFTQEEVAELLDISVESVRAYEAGKTIPKIDTVDKMCTLYRSPELKLIHIALSAGDNTMIPVINVSNICMATLNFLKESTDTMQFQQRLIEIASDGKVSREEEPDIMKFISKLFRVRKASYELECAVLREVSYSQRGG